MKALVLRSIEKGRPSPNIVQFRPGRGAWSQHLRLSFCRAIPPDHGAAAAGLRPHRRHTRPGLAGQGLGPRPLKLGEWGGDPVMGHVSIQNTVKFLGE